MRNRSIRRTSSASDRSFASRSAWRGVAPPLPPTYRFQPVAVAMIPKSFDWASAHSRAQPDTADLSLCGERNPR